MPKGWWRQADARPSISPSPPPGTARWRSVSPNTASYREAHWRTVEEPLDIAAAIARESTAGSVVLVECLTLWLSNLMGAGRAIEAETDGLIEALERAAGPVVLVSNEVGGGIMPDNALARRYVDALGTLNQRVAAVATEVVLVAAGQPLILKPSREPEVTL